MKSRFFKLAVVVAMTFTYSFVFLSSSTGAVSGSFRQQILPLDCIFQVINDGTGLLFYVTPEECGVVVPPQPASPTPGVTPAVPDNPSPARLQILSPISIPASSQNTHTESRPATYPWRPLVSVGDTNIQKANQSDLPRPAPPAAGVLAAAAVLLIIIIIIL